MAAALDKPSTSSAKMKPPIPPKPVLSSIGTEKERNGESPSAIKRSCTATPEIFTSDSEPAESGSEIGASTSKQESLSGRQVKRSHSTLAETGSQYDPGAKVKRHHSAKEEKVPSTVSHSEDEAVEESSKEKTRKEGEDFQTRVRDCFWTPLASFVVRTKAGGAELIERGSKKFFKGKVFSQKKRKKPLPTPSNGDSVRSRPQVPPRPVLLGILQSIRQSEPGIWYKLDHVKYIDEDASTEDSTDYTDVDWGKALGDSGDEEIIYYTYIEEHPNEKVVFFQRSYNHEYSCSSDDLEEMMNGELKNHVASMENMDIEVIETEMKSETEHLETADVPNGVDVTMPSDVKPSTPDELSTNQEIFVNGDENANAPLHVNDEIVEKNVESVIVASQSPATRKKSPEYAYVQKSGTSDHARQSSQVSGSASETYYDLDVKPKIKPRRPPLPARKPFRSAPPVPPKTYRSSRTSAAAKDEPNKSKIDTSPAIVDEETTKIVEEAVPAALEIAHEVCIQEVVTVEISENVASSEGVRDENQSFVDNTQNDKDQQTFEDNNQECASPDPSFIIHEEEQLKETFEVSSTTPDNRLVATPAADDFSERRSQWAESEMSLDMRPSYWDSRSISIPPSFTSESGFISSPTPPPRRRKKRHHSVEGVVRTHSEKDVENGGRRSKSCSDAEIAKLTESPCIAEIDDLQPEPSSPVRPQRPPRPSVKPKPERPPKPKPVSVRKLIPSPNQDTSSLIESDRESVASSIDGSSRIRMNERPLPAPPAPPRQRSPWVTKKIFKTSSVKSLDEEFVSDKLATGQPVGNVRSKFSAEFLDRIAEIEAGNMKVSELKVHRITVDELDASVIRVGTLHVGQITPLALIAQGKESGDSLDRKGFESPSKMEDSTSVDVSSHEVKEENKLEEEKDKSDDDEKKKKNDDGKDGKQNKKDDDDFKGSGGGFGGDNNNGGDGTGGDDGKRDDDSQPPTWWKEAEPPSDPQHPGSDSVMTGKLAKECSPECKDVNNLNAGTPISDRLIATDRTVVTNSKFYLGEDRKTHSPSPTPSQKSACSNSSGEFKKDNVKIVGRSSWYDEGHAGDVDTSDGWVDGQNKRKDVQERNKIVDSDVEDVSQIRRQLASLVSVNSQENRRSSQHRLQDDHLSSSSTTDVEQDEPKRAHGHHKHYNRTHSTSSQDSARITQTESDRPKLDPNANYYDDECETPPALSKNEQTSVGSNPKKFQSSNNGHHDDYSGLKRSASTHSASCSIRSQSTRLDAASLLSLPTSEDSWHNCTSGDESDTESFVTSHSCFEDSDTVERKALKRFYIAKELMTSERVFVDVLKLLNEDFREVVMQANKKNSNTVIPDSVFNQILQYLPQLQNLNEDLLKDLTERIEKWDEIGRIADVIVKKGPFLKLYSSYIKDFESITTSLSEACRKYPAFALVVKEFEMSERCQRLAIRHYLLKPVQRIPQYKLLLEDYLKRLSPDSVDYQDTITALTIVSDVANHANQTMKEGDNFAKLLQIQNNLIGNYEIIKPGRSFLKEGELYKLSRKVMQPRWFILFNDSLLHTDMQQQGCYRLHHDLQLAGMKVMLPTNEEYQNEFSIISVTRSFTLSAPSPLIRDEWIKALNEAIEANAKRRGTFASVAVKRDQAMASGTVFQLGKQAPVWIPDVRVTMCQLCTCAFTVTFRRHHCRACGKVVCSNCSANRAPLQYLKYESARVCDECYEKLSQEFEASENTVNESPGSTECGESDEKASGAEDGSSVQKANLKAQFKRYGLPHAKKERHLPKVLKEVCANHQGALHSGYLQKRVKKSWRKLWFVINDKVLYTYKACEDVAALESIPLLGFTVVRGPPEGQVFEAINSNFIFHLSHPGQSSMIFCADSDTAAEKWTKAMESASVLE